MLELVNRSYLSPNTSSPWCAAQSDCSIRNQRKFEVAA